MSTASLIIVEDEGLVALDLKRRLERMGYSVAAQASGGREAVEKARETAPDLVLMDICLGEDLDGIEAAEIIRQRFQVPVVYLTAHSDAATLERAKATDPHGYVLKPFRDRELQIAIEMALYKHRAEMMIRESREWLAATLRSVGEAVIANDKDGAIRFMNPAAEKLTGWREQEAKGRPLSDILRLLDGTTREAQKNPVRRIVSEGRPHPLPENTLLLPKEGEPVPIEDSFAPIKEPHGGVLGAVLVFHDVTLRREAERRIRQLNEELARNVAELDAFSCSVAHDLRGPLRSMNGFSAILLEDYEQKLDEDGKQLLLASSLIAVGNTLEHVVALVLLRRLVRSDSPFEQARDVFCFLATAAFSCAVASTNGAASLWLTGIIPGPIHGPAWFTWWLGDTTGMLILAPALYCWWRQPRLGFSGPFRRMARERGNRLAALSRGPGPVVGRVPLRRARNRVDRRAPLGDRRRAHLGLDEPSDHSADRAAFRLCTVCRSDNDA